MMTKCTMITVGRQRLSKYATITSVLQVALLATILNAKFASVYATMSPEMTAINGDLTDANELTDNVANAEEKRNWQALHGSWGKRFQPGVWGADTNEEDDDVYVGDHFPMPVLPAAVLITNAALLEHLANQRQAADARFNSDLLSPIEELEAGNGILTEKRDWKAMNAAWGKRRNAPNWNKFSGSWGKREPGWNNLKGMWGKRAGAGWQKLHGSWGKRAANNN